MTVIILIIFGCNAQKCFLFLWLGTGALRKLTSPCLLPNVPLVSSTRGNWGMTFTPETEFSGWRDHWLEKCPWDDFWICLMPKGSDEGGGRRNSICFLLTSYLRLNEALSFHWFIYWGSFACCWIAYFLLCLSGAFSFYSAFNDDFKKPFVAKMCSIRINPFFSV